MSLGWIPSLWGGRVNLVTLSVKGGAAGGDLKEVESCSSVAVTHVVRVPRAFIMSLNVSSDSSSDEMRSGGGCALFLILVVSPFLVGFILVFNLGAIVR